MRLNVITPVRRSAVLIGNDRWGGGKLPGVPVDFASMKRFLLSPEGGVWSQNEIYEVTQPMTLQGFVCELQDIVSRCEYVFIYFCGHGEMNPGYDPVFVLPGGDEIALCQIREQLKELPVLMISDSCQMLPKLSDGGRLTESRKMFSQGNPVDEFKARRKFDAELRTLPPMFTYASAVSAGETANEDSDGGIYSQSLLKACHNIINGNDEPDVYGICYPHILAKTAVIAKTENKQHPTISGYNRTFQPPFLVKLR